MDEHPSAHAAEAELTESQIGTLQASVLIGAICGIVYELLIASVSSYLLGNSVYQFSITIGLFMFAMGVGSFVSRRFDGSPIRLAQTFVVVEILLAAVGGLTTAVLFFVYPWIALYKPVMITMTLFIGALVGLEIPILTRLLLPSAGIKKSIANVLGLDYFGALVGSVSFPLLLLPYLGLFRAAFVVGLINIAIAIVIIRAFKGILPRERTLMVISIAIALYLVAGIIVSTGLTRFAESRLFQQRIVLIEQSKYQRIVVTVDENSGLHRLYLDGHLQFAEKDEHRYHEALVHPAMLVRPNTDNTPRNVLILGGGDGLAIREVLKHDNVNHIDLVDIDPKITTLCRRFSPIAKLNQDALDHERVTVHHMDAFTFMQRAGDDYHVIIIDLPDPHNESLAKLYSEQFYRLVSRRLADDGVLVSQSSSPFHTRTVYWSIGKTMQAAGLNTVPFRSHIPSFGDWGFHMASAAPLDRTHLTDLDFTIDTKYLTPEVFAGNLNFGHDDGPTEDAIVNSMFVPRIYLIYERELANSG